MKYEMQDYVRIRKLPVTILGANSRFLGIIETLGGPIGQLFRDIFFRVSAKIGIVKRIFIGGAIPRVGL
mgnify:CR=1 FL=1